MLAVRGLHSHSNNKQASVEMVDKRGGLQLIAVTC